MDRPLRLPCRFIVAPAHAVWVLALLALGVQAQGAPDPAGPARHVSPCFPVHRLTLEGESATQFQWALDAAHRADNGQRDPPLPRCLGQEDIATLTRRVQGALLERGYVTTQVLLPAQDLRTGTLRLAILPGRVAAVRLQRDELGRGTVWNALTLQPGQILNLRDIEQVLENLQRVPTVDADIEIAPSEPTPERPQVHPGDSDLLVRWRQRLPFRMALSADDSGTRATGRYRGSITVAYDNALNLNDLLHVTLSANLRPSGPGSDAGAGAHGMRAYSAHYSLPWGRWLFAVQTSQQDFHQTVAGLTQNYTYRGESSLHDLRLSRLVHRSAVGKSHLSLRGWSRQSRNYIDDTEVEVQRRRTAGWELGVQHQQAVAAATLGLALAYRRGTGAWQALPAPEDPFGEGASRPRILSADLSLVWPLGLAHTRYAATASVQWTRQALVPHDRFSIGGRYTVRGFDGESTLSAARGGWLRQELQWTPGGHGQALYLGLDHGEVGGAASDTLAGTRLTGMVVGLRGGLRNASWDFFAARPLKKPEMFHTARRTAGFSIHLSF